MAVKNNKETTLDPNESNYLKATNLNKAIRSLIREKDKADMYEDVAKIYQSLGDYKDSAEMYAQCIKKAAEHRKLAEECEKKNSDKQAVLPDDSNNKKSILPKIIFIIGLLILVFAVGFCIYLKTKPGRYARASFYEKSAKYEKSYKMFDALKTYKDSEDRRKESYYEYAIQCVTKKQFETAKKAFRSLKDYKDSEQKLASVEIEIIKNGKIGANILFGGYRWLIAEKQDDKVLLIKSQPVNGYAYNENAKDVTWETCSLRAYLNNEFLHEVFTDFMIESIVDTEVAVPDNTKYGTKGGKATTDKIFLLNADQFNKYSNILSNYFRDCWLINPGSSQSTAQFVSYGAVMDYGYDVTNTNIHIRPALWITVK